MGNCVFLRTREPSDQRTFGLGSCHPTDAHLYSISQHVFISAPNKFSSTINVAQASPLLQYLNMHNVYMQLSHFAALPHSVVHFVFLFSNTHCLIVLSTEDKCVIISMVTEPQYICPTLPCIIIVCFTLGFLWGFVKHFKHQLQKIIERI